MNESGTQGAQIPQTDAVDRVKHKTQTIALVTGVDLDEHKARQAIARRQGRRGARPGTRPTRTPSGAPHLLRHARLRANRT